MTDAQARIAGLESALAARTAEVARLQEEMQQFAYVASHDLQEPLRMVSSYCQLLQKRYAGQLGASGDEFLAFAVDGATRMSAMLRDLLAWSRVATRGKPPEEIGARVALDAALRILRDEIRDAAAEVEAGELPVVRADPDQLVLVFQHLVSNAVKFRRAGTPPRVRVACERAGSDWLFSVADNGVGFDPSMSARLFGIFQRLVTRTEYPGNGIGLAVVRRIVERHGGRVAAESTPGHGAVFRFALPAETP